VKVADTTLFEGGQYWGLLRMDNLNRQCVRILAQHSQTGEWKPVAEFIIINGKLAFTVYGESQHTGTKGAIEGGDANESGTNADTRTSSDSEGSGGSSKIIAS
jgi:hypothetical protein